MRYHTVTNKLKEVTHMKAAHSYNHRTYARRHPNAAETSYFLDRFADGLLCAASSVGILTVFFFLLTM